MKEYYKILNLSSEKASQKEIENNYIELAKKYHPDKNPSIEDKDKFKQIVNAYNVLNDKKLRDIYDQHDIKGIEEEEKNRNIQNSAFMSRFCTEDIILQIPYTLEESYNGCKKTIQIKKDIICKKCKGYRTKTGREVIQSAKNKCTTCQGRGFYVEKNDKMQFPTPFLNSFLCKVCDGALTMVKVNDQCNICKGMGVVEETCEFSFEIPRGVENGRKICFEGQSNQHPIVRSGNIILVFNEIPHPIFKRLKQHLLLTQTIGLKDILLGFDLKIIHLSGIEYNLVYRPNEKQILNSHELRKIQGLGTFCLSKKKSVNSEENNLIQGDLFMQFNINIPSYNDFTINNIDNLPNSSKQLPKFYNDQENSISISCISSVDEIK